jgi:hypothetical protein
MPPHRKSYTREEEWHCKVLHLVTALLIFETLTGLAIWLLPFSVSSQVMVLLHTILGIAFLVPYAWYQVHHWLVYRSRQMTHIKLTGYLAMTATLVAIVSGGVLTVQAVAHTRISYAWDMVHIISTVAVLASALPHVLLIVFRDYKARAAASIQPLLRAERKYGTNMLYIVGVLFGTVALGVYAYQPVELDNELPEDYNYLYGADRPFAPSLARTDTDEAFDARTLGNSSSCGRSGCHVEIVKEWEVSAHRWAASDPAFRSIQTVMGEQNGPESTRYCGGCHDPISLFAGSKNLFRAELTNPLGLDEGVSCIACHAIEETDIKGNANYTIVQPERYLFELHDGDGIKVVSDFLIRAYPKQHVESLQHRRFKSPEFCAACHKQFIDEEINKVGWVQLQNQYDNWRKSRWNHPGDATKTVECRECHMPLVDSFDPASGDPLDYNRTPEDGKHRSHRFLGANQYIPAQLELEGADEQVQLTHEWLKGNIEIPEIAEKWRDGPVAPVEIYVPESVSPGENVTVEVTITNNKAGHDFPTGPSDIIQAWLQVVVTDQEGNEIFVSGGLDDRAFIEPGAFMFKAEPIDQYGKLIDRHNLWDMVGVRYRRSLFPGFSDKAAFTFGCPVSIQGAGEGMPNRQQVHFDAPDRTVTALHVRATLMYRKINQFLLNEMFGEEDRLTAPITELSSDTKVIQVDGG